MDKLDFMYEKVMNSIKGNSPTGTLTYRDFFIIMSYYRLSKQECEKILVELEKKGYIKTGVMGIEVKAWD